LVASDATKLGVVGQISTPTTAPPRTATPPPRCSNSWRVLEYAVGAVIGIEVKAAETVRAEDFRGLRHLRPSTLSRSSRSSGRARC